MVLKRRRKKNNESIILICPNCGREWAEVPMNRLGLDVFKEGDCYMSHMQCAECDAKEDPVIRRILKVRDKGKELE